MLEGSNVGDGELVDVGVIPGVGIRVEVGDPVSGVSAIGEGVGLGVLPTFSETAGVVRDESELSVSGEPEHSDARAPVTREVAVIEAVSATARA